MAGVGVSASHSALGWWGTLLGYRRDEQLGLCRELRVAPFSRCAGVAVLLRDPMSSSDGGRTLGLYSGAALPLCSHFFCIVTLCCVLTLFLQGNKITAYKNN